MFGWNFFAKYKHTVAVLLAAVTGLSVVFLCRVRPDENIHAMIPAKLLRQVELFEHSPLNKKIFVGVTADSAEEAFSAAESLRNRLAEAGLVNHSLSNFDAVCEAAAQEGKIRPEDIRRLQKFRSDPVAAPPCARYELCRYPLSRTACPFFTVGRTPSAKKADAAGGGGKNAAKLQQFTFL